MESNIQSGMNEFRKALEFTLKWEGGYVNDPDDPGGETKWGISKRAYPDEDITNLTPERAAELYYRDYWVASGCESLPFPMSVVVFDTAVNLGTGRAKGFVRNANENSGGDGGAADILRQRTGYYLDLVKKKPALQKYLKGWLNRLNDLKKFCEINSSS